MELAIPKKRGRGKPTVLQIEETRAHLAQLEVQHKQELEQALSRNRTAIVDAITASKLDSIPVAKWTEVMPSIAALLANDASTIA